MGSEMCIRDRCTRLHGEETSHVYVWIPRGLALRMDTSANLSCVADARHNYDSQRLVAQFKRVEISEIVAFRRESLIACSSHVSRTALRITGVVDLLPSHRVSLPAEPKPKLLLRVYVCLALGHSSASALSNA